MHCKCWWFSSSYVWFYFNWYAPRLYALNKYSFGYSFCLGLVILLGCGAHFTEYKVRVASHFAVTALYYSWIVIYIMKNGGRYPSNKFNYKKNGISADILEEQVQNLRILFWIWSKNDHEIKYLERKSSPIHFQSILMKSEKENLQKNQNQTKMRIQNIRWKIIIIKSARRSSGPGKRLDLCRWRPNSSVSRLFIM